MKRIFLLFFVCVLFVASCASTTPIATATAFLTPSQTPSPTRTRPPTRTPTASVTPLPSSTQTLTSTPQPTLEAHAWKPEPVLVSYHAQGGFLCGLVCPPYPLPFILYGDGTLIISNSVETSEEYKIRYLYKKLSQNEICRLLSTIDQAGFFDFDPDTYSFEGIYDAPNWEIQVNAWNKKQVSLYALGEVANDTLRSLGFLNGVEYNIPPSALNTFVLLDRYPLDGFSEYVDLIGVWVWKSSNNYESKVWTVENPSLADLYRKAGSLIDKLPSPIILSKKEAQGVYAAFNNSEYYGAVTEGDEIYQVYIRPILPFEKISGEISTISPSSSQLKLQNKMQCSPSDGVMPIPTLTNP